MQPQPKTVRGADRSFDVVAEDVLARFRDWFRLNFADHENGQLLPSDASIEDDLVREIRRTFQAQVHLLREQRDMLLALVWHKQDPRQLKQLTEESPTGVVGDDNWLRKFLPHAAWQVVVAARGPGEHKGRGAKLRDSALRLIPGGKQDE